MTNPIEYNGKPVEYIQQISELPSKEESTIIKNVDQFYQTQDLLQNPEVGNTTPPKAEHE